MIKTKDYIIILIIFIFVIILNSQTNAAEISSKSQEKNSFIVTDSGEEDSETLAQDTVIANASSELNSEKYFQNSNKGLGFSTGFYYMEIDGNIYEIPNIVSTNKYGTVEKKDNNTEQIYSIFPTQNMQNIDEAKRYSKNFDLKQYNFINEQYQKAFPESQENLNELFWILNNLCNTIDDNSKDDLLDAAQINRQIFKTYKINGKSTEQSENDLIKVIQQVVIWKICSGNISSIPTLYVSYTKNGEKVNLNEAFKNYDNAAEKLYAHFMNSAINAVTNGYEYQKSDDAPVNLDKSRAKIIEEGANYILGPYKVNTNNGFDTFDISITDGINEISNAQVLREDKKSEIQGNSILEKVKSNLGNDFYIVIPLSTSATKLRIEVKAKFERKKLTYYSTNVNEINNSIPIVKVKNERIIYVNYDVKKIIKPSFDLSVREFISTVNNKELKENRESKVSQSDLSKFAQGKSELDSGTTVTKNTIKTPLRVYNGDLLTITIRVYNEGQIDGIATELTNYFQDGLEFIEDSEVNTKYGWTKDEEINVLKTSYLADKKIKAFSNEKINSKYVLNYEEVKLELKVVADVKTTDTILKDVTEISSYENDKNEKDRDSVANNLKSEQISNYSAGSSSAGKGYEDDDDFEVVDLIGQYFDLSLRLFVSQVDSRTGGEVNYNREPKVDVSPLKEGKSDAIYKASKSPVGIENADSIVYTIRVYNEGQIDGYADEIVTHLPEELEYVNDEFNAGFGWIIDKTDATQRTLKTSYLSMERDEDNAITAFNSNDDKLNYKDIKLKLKLKPVATVKKEITTIAEIIKSSNKYGISDRDNKLNVSMPSDKDLSSYKGNSDNKDELSDSSYYYKGQEDDDDFEKIVFEKFDLALRVFETGINGKAVDDRIPVIDANQFGASTDSKIYTTCQYNHKKDVINVNENDKIEFTIRVYNEGTQKGYAKEIRNDIPDGLEFIQEDQINKQFAWKMYDENGSETNESSKCAYVKTSYLSKENEKDNLQNAIEPFDKGKMKSPDYKEIKIVLNIKLKDKNNRDVIQKVQISDDSDEDGNQVLDIDSAPNKWNTGEDDQDEEKIHILKFDLSLKQEIMQIITIENGIEKSQNANQILQNNYKNSQEKDQSLQNVNQSLQEVGKNDNKSLQNVNQSLQEVDKNDNKSLQNINQSLQEVDKNDNKSLQNANQSLQNNSSLIYEINKNTLENKVVKFKYIITITNEGETPGTASEISAYVPKGLIFNQADNMEWKQKGSKIVTDELKKISLSPREDTKVELILTLDYSVNSSSELINVCEISKTQSVGNANDVDSVENNSKDGEDDYSKSSIFIKTTKTIAKVWLLIISGAIIIVIIGAIVIKKLL